MNLIKQLILFVAGVLMFAASVTQAEASVYGNVGYKEYPWRILIGYNDDYRGYINHYHGHHHHKYYHKHKKHHYKKHYHHKHHGYSHYYRHNHRYHRRSCQY